LFNVGAASAENTPPSGAASPAAATLFKWFLAFT
jgi:hypothetical protein